jgi:hypothetical protein
MIRFTALLLKFGAQGEKTGWTYFVIPAKLAQQLKPENKRSFRVKGKLDGYPIKAVALIPMGEGDFIMPLNAAMRKALKKQKGDKLVAQLQEDKSDFVFDADMMTCLRDEPAALAFFKKLPGSHQRYFSKWIQSAKTEATKARRIAQAVNALARGLGYAQMLRALKAQREQ